MSVCYNPSTVSTKIGIATHRWFFLLFPFALCLAALLSTFVLQDVLAKRDLLQLEMRTAAEANHVGAQLRTGVLQAFDALPRIGDWWLSQGRPLAPEDWEADARLFIRVEAGLKSVSWVMPDQKRSWTVRPGGSLRPDSFEQPAPELLSVVELARQRNALVVSPVFEVDGRSLVYGVVPLTRRGKLAGFVGGLYDVDELIRSVLAGQNPPDYSIVIAAEGSDIASIVSPERAAWSAGARAASVVIANAVWAVRLVPSASSVATLRRLVIGFGVLVSILVYACAAMAMTARMRARRIAELNRDLQRGLQEFNTLLDVLPAGIAVAEDPECRNIWINRSMAAMLQVPFGENISKSFDGADKLTYQLRHDGVEVPAEELPMQTAARTRAPVANQELEIIRKDGSSIHTLSYAAPLLEENGAVRGVINSCVDITERKRAEEEQRSFLMRSRELEQRAERAEKYQSLALMAGGIAHDFNNLLTVIIGQAELLAMDLPKRGEMRSNLASLTSAANRAAQLTSRLLAFTGHIWCTASPIRLGEVVLAMQPAIRAMVPTSIELRYRLSSDLPVVPAGVPELQQVIQHLVENAVEAIGGKLGTIEILTNECELSVEQIEFLDPDHRLAAGSYVRLEIIDNGCGIPKEIATRIFDPFFTTKFTGRGLGLSATQGIMRAQGGAVRLESLQPSGTRAEVILPVNPSRNHTGTREEALLSST
jgi:signal transduction histidine kinase/sensor domain CHASE-containing protein